MAIRFAVTDNQGNILRTGICSRKCFTLQRQTADEYVVIPPDADVRDDTHKVEDLFGNTTRFRELTKEEQANRKRKKEPHR